MTTKHSFSARSYLLVHLLVLKRLSARDSASVNTIARAESTKATKNTGNTIDMAAMKVALQMSASVTTHMNQVVEDISTKKITNTKSTTSTTATGEDLAPLNLDRALSHRLLNCSSNWTWTSKKFHHKKGVSTLQLLTMKPAF